ncbi:MAG: hypothetical protein LAN62_14965 [Acidobacteriia bacterium]|nr:hypothetical protein [Terriglobia bacterium]
MSTVFCVISTVLALSAIYYLASASFAQQPQAQQGQPIYAVNAKYVQGVGIGYWPTAGSGLTLNIAPGTAFCSNLLIQHPGGTLTMSPNTTNYVYLNAQANCAPAVKTGGFSSSSDIPIAVVTTGGSNITGVTDARTWFVANDKGFLDVRDFGAKCDGTTDDTAAFNAATTAGTYGYHGRAFSLYVPVTQHGCYLASPLNLTGLPVGFALVGGSGPGETPGDNTSRIILGASTLGVDVTGTGTFRMENITLAAPPSGGPKVGLLCARSSVSGSDAQISSLRNISVHLNSTGNASDPSIGFYNAGCELLSMDNLTATADLPYYATTQISLFPVSSPYQNIVSNPGSTSMNQCSRCTFVSSSSLQPPLYLDNGVYDSDFPSLYLGCQGAGASTQYAMLLKHLQGLKLAGRQEGCAYAAHVVGGFTNSHIELTSATGTTGTNPYIVVDGTTGGTPYNFEGNTFEIFDTYVRGSAFTAYRWDSASYYVSANTFDGRSGGCDGGVSISAGASGVNTLRGKGYCSGATITGSTTSVVETPSGINMTGLVLPTNYWFSNGIFFDELGDITLGSGSILANDSSSDLNLWALNGTNRNIFLYTAGTGITHSRNFSTDVNVVAWSATPAFDAALGNTQKLTLGGNVTSSTLSNATAGEQINFLICQDATGNRTFVWPSNVKGGMTIGSTASKCSAQTFIFDGTSAYALSAGVTNM